MSKVVNLQWYNGRYGYVYRDAPTLVISYDNGRMQIMRDESDDSKYFHIFQIKHIGGGGGVN